MKVLITGADGQLGSALLRTAPPHTDLNAIDVDDADFTEVEMLRARLVVEAPEIIINAAAYIPVDETEAEEALAREVNADAVTIMVEAMKDTGGKLVHISCNHVFDGAAARAYSPGDAINPLSALGRSKAEGEGYLRPQDLLVRTSWLYEAGGANFVRDMIKRMQENDEIEVAADQVSSPTRATALADAIWAMIERQASGIFHYSDAGEVSLYDVAAAIAEESLSQGLIERRPEIKPIMTVDDEGKPRSAFSPLDCSATHAFFGSEPVDWRTNLRLMLIAEKALG